MLTSKEMDRLIRGYFETINISDKSYDCYTPEGTLVAIYTNYEFYDSEYEEVTYALGVVKDKNFVRSIELHKYLLCSVGIYGCLDVSKTFEYLNRFLIMFDNAFISINAPYIIDVDRLKPLLWENMRYDWYADEEAIVMETIPVDQWPDWSVVRSC